MKKNIALLSAIILIILTVTACENASGTASTKSRKQQFPNAYCKVSGCENKRKTHSEYCENHACQFLDCTNRALISKKYCSYHNCKHTGCYECAVDGYCAYHECIEYGCENEQYGDTCYCEDHQYIWESYLAGKEAEEAKEQREEEKYSSGGGVLIGDDDSSASNKKSTSSKKTEIDPYDAQNYTEADDFYYDHPDDFLDYEDAEEYLEEYWEKVKNR